MSLNRDQILQRYIEEIELSEDQATVFCCMVQLIPTVKLAAVFVHADISKGMTIRAASRKWGITPTVVYKISKQTSGE